ncbi:MAG: hypothetical protein DI526_11065 [Caulobacter segnis]|uniref:Uncharacterized protein n=2 Tax=Caulobacter segnis TaxID=88688 RepID=A0A2W5V2K9_9CAUL|nr:MAG: hypothetical protein DI526_11065 [Caulobacter segnis]
MAPIIADAIVLVVILVTMTIVSYINVKFHPPAGVVFFSGAAFPLRLSLILDAIDVAVVILFGVRTVWHSLKGVLK